MASEIRVNQIQNRSGLGTVTFSDSGVVISGITTISDLRISGNTIVAAGSTSAPSISPSGDSNTGIFFPAADTIAASTGGTSRITIDSSGNINIDNGTVFVDAVNNRLGIGTTSPSQPLHIATSSGSAYIQQTNGTATTYLGPDGSNTGLFGTSTNHDIRFMNNNTERVRIDTSGRLLVGTSTAPSAGDGQYGKVVIQGYTGDNTAQAYLSLQRGEVATSVSSSEEIAAIGFNSSDGYPFAAIKCFADAAAGAGDYPGRLVFSTTADGASSPTERMKIDNAGNLFSYQTYASTTVNAANINIQPDGRFYRSTSSIKYKTDVETLGDEYADAILNCRPVWYRSTTGNDAPDWGWWGFIAEEVAEIDPRLVSWKTQEISYDDKGSAVTNSCEPEPEGVQYDRFVPHLLNLIKRQQQAIETLEAKVAALEAA